LFTQSIPLVTGTTDKQTPEALRLAANSSGSLATLAAIRRAFSRDCAGRRRNIRSVVGDLDFVALSANKNPREADMK
jgi:hypothetical protein